MRAVYVLWSLLSLTFALPAQELEPRQGLAGLLSGLKLVNLPTILDTIPAVLDTATKVTLATAAIESSISAGSIADKDASAVIKVLFNAVKPVSTPTSAAQATSLAAAAKGGTQISSAPTKQSILLSALLCKVNGITSPDLQAALNGALGGATCSQASIPELPNSNSRRSLTCPSSGSSSTKVSRRNDQQTCSQPGYITSINTLLSAICTTPGFEWNGNKKTLILSPGTGSTAVTQFPYNIGKLLQQRSDVQVAYLNIPMNLLGDIQINAEYVSAAILYFAIRTKRKPTLVTWSQGSLDAQWAYKYFPCTRCHVEEHIAFSPDYHGTKLAALLCPGGVLNGLACTPAIAQQFYESNFVNTLRGGDGSSSYVDTTTIYSATDEIVQPQIDPVASGFLPAGCNSKTSNTFLQTACAGKPAGGLVTHEGVLYNGAAYALLIDAITHDGPADFSRVSASCANLVAPGLTVQDVINTEAILLLIAYNIVTYNPKSATEPTIKDYAKNGAKACGTLT